MWNAVLWHLNHHLQHSKEWKVGSVTDFLPCWSCVASISHKYQYFNNLNYAGIFCFSPWASSPSDPAGCRDDAKHSPPQQQQHSAGKDLELCKYWQRWLSWARNFRRRLALIAMQTLPVLNFWKIYLLHPRDVGRRQGEGSFSSEVKWDWGLREQRGEREQKKI